MPIQLTERAVFARVSRRLAREEISLRRCREDSRWFHDLGRYYTVNERNHICGQDIQLFEYAQELGVVGKNDTMVAS